MLFYPQNKIKKLFREENNVFFLSRTTKYTEATKPTCFRVILVRGCDLVQGYCHATIYRDIVISSVQEVVTHFIL